MKKVSKKSKRRLIIFAPLSILAIVYFFMTLASCLFNFTSLKIEQNNLEDELTSLQDKKTNLKQEITKLNDPNYIARYAKENYLYSSDGEYVIKLDDNDSETTEITEKSEYNIYVVIVAAFLILFILIMKHLKRRHKKKAHK